jgi:hypothetical protein
MTAAAPPRAASGRPGDQNLNYAPEYQERGRGTLNCAKNTIYFFNFFVLILGGAVLGLGIWAMVHLKGETLTSHQNPIIYSVIAIGALVVFTSLIGCCGACCENRCGLGLFLLLIAALALSEAGAGMWCHFGSNKVIDDLSMYWNRSDTDFLHDLQDKLHCCGFSTIDDRVVLPCNHTDACGPKLEHNLHLVFNVLMWSSFGFCGVMVLAFLFGLIMICALNTRDQKGEYMLVNS